MRQRPHLCTNEVVSSLCERVRGIAIRDELTDEWKRRDVGAEGEYAILTAEISKATFGMQEM